MITMLGWKGFKGKELASRELQCVIAIASGQSVKEAARTLGMAPSTTTKRIASAMFKLGVNKQAAMVSEALKRGLIAPLMILVASFAGYHSAVSLDADHQRRGPSRRIAEVRVMGVRAVMDRVA